MDDVSTWWGRTRRLNDAPPRPQGRYVLYWMTAARRLGWSHALDRAIAAAERLGRPLVVFEAVSAGYRWASDRHHRFLLDGMAEHADRLAGSPVGYVPYVEPTAGAGRGLLARLARDAAWVITDDAPVFFTPALIDAATRLQGVRVEAVDGCGLLPIREGGRAFTTAYSFRRFLHKALPEHLGDAPADDPLRRLSLPRWEGLPEDVLARWSPASGDRLRDPRYLSRIDIDHSVGPVPLEGGTGAGRRRLQRFVADGLSRYADERNDPDREATSGLSPWLHFGHVSPHEVFRAVADGEAWTPLRLSTIADGRRRGWWGMSASAEAFLDQLVTWRELGFGYAAFAPDHESYESLPAWARETLEAHASDPREHVYPLEQLASAETSDELWNAAQRQLLGEGVIHSYLRMLWGKRILEWTSGPREALSAMIELNNRYALDGRDPNSHSGISWCLGRFDRGWPERPVFGKVRSMTSASTRRKVSVTRYLERWGRQATLELAGL